MTTKLSQKVLNRIHKECIEPKPRWRFLVRDWTLWISGAVSLIVGSVAVSVVIFILVNNDWTVSRILHGTSIGGVMAAIPFLWLATFAAFATIAHYNVCHTKRGYQFHTFILIMAVAVPIVFGYALYRTGVSYVTEALLNNYFPQYQTMLERREAMWLNPNEGFLGGKIISLEDDGHCILRDREGNEWNVRINDDDHQYLQTYMQKEEAFIGVVGSLGKDGVFKAKMVRVLPLRGMRRHMMEEYRQNFGNFKEEGNGRYRRGHSPMKP